MNHLPESGRYIFEFIKDREVIHSRILDYVQDKIGYPVNVNWERRGNNLYVKWTPPDGINKGMSYKVLVWNREGTPKADISTGAEWDDISAVIENAPLIDGGNYTLNIALYYTYGYAYSKYIHFTW